MDKFKENIKLIGLVVSTTVGAGMFALPFVFQEAGWGIGAAYLVALSAILIFIHYLYWQTLRATGGGVSLLALIKNKFGRFYFWLASLAIIGGLMLSLVAYLILSASFIGVVFPGWDARWIIFAFWLVSAAPLLLRLKRFVFLEFIGAVLMLFLIAFIFASSGAPLKIFEFSAADFQNGFLPFGAVLFALASWTAVEPVFRSQKESTGVGRSLLVFGWATAISAILYLLFVAGIFGSALTITEDTISGLINWPLWKLLPLSALGLFAIWTSYLPINLEIRNSLAGLGWSERKSNYLAIFAPPALLLLGLRDFLSVIGLAGGVFLGLQYVFIAATARKTLELRGAKKFFAGLTVFVFLLAVVYEIFYFVK